MPIDSKECFTSLTTDGQLYEIYLAAQANGGGGGGGAFGAIYYFNRSNASSISGYYEMSKNLVIGAGTTLTATGAGTHLVGSFATVLNDPNVTTIPSGNWNFENYISMSSNGGTPKIYGEIYSRNLAGTETLIATNISNPHPITSGTLNELYLWSIPVPATIVLATDRLVVKFYALDLGGRTMTMHFEDANVAQTTTSLPSVDLSAYVLKAGDTMTGKLNLPASTALSAPVNIGTGSAPTSPINGDIWLAGSNLTWKGTSADIQEAAALKKANIFTRAQAVQLGVTDVGIGLKITNLGSGESLRIEDESPESTPFVVSASGRVGVGVTPDATVALSVDTTGVKFGDNTIQTTAGVAKTGDTMTGKLNLSAITANQAPTNLGTNINPGTLVGGDIWIGTDNIFKWRASTGATYPTASTAIINTFAQPQIISTPISTSTPALRITQNGPGEALRVEDETTPDATAFVVSTAGKVGIGVTPDVAVALSVDTTGIKFGDNTIQTTAASAGTKTLSRFTPDNNQPPATNFATLDTRNSIAVLDFDDTTDKNAIFLNVISEAATLGSGLKIRLIWTATTATTGDCVWQTALEKMTTDIDADSFDTAASATATTNATSGVPNYTEITLTTIDSVTAGDGFRIRITRNATSASDTMTGDAELIAVEIRSAA